MMNLQIFSKISMLLLFALAIKVSPAHSVHNHTHDHHQGEPHIETSSVDELINQYARTGDDDLLARAWRVLLPKLKQEDATLWLQAAWLAQSEHNFYGSQVYLERVLALKPHHGIALLMKANNSAVMGDLESANRACKQTFGAVDLVVTQSCLARLAQKKPDQLKALRRLQDWPEAEIDVRFQAWVDETIALLAAATGELKVAEAAYKKALSLNPTIALVAAYADVLLAQDRPENVLELIDITEATPALALRRLLAAKALGINQESMLASIDRQFSQWHEAKDFRHAREMALFYAFVLPDLNLAKKLAELNVLSQKEMIDIELGRLFGVQL